MTEQNDEKLREIAEQRVAHLQSLLDDFDRENADDIDADDFNIGQDEWIEVPTIYVRTVLKLLSDKAALEAERDGLRAALEQVQRMRTMPDDKLNTFTLGMAHKIAHDALSALKETSDAG